MGQKPTGPASEFSVRVAAEIDRARREANMPTKTLIEKSGIGNNTYFTKMRGERPFNTNEIDLLAQALGADPILILKAAAQTAKITPIRQNVSTGQDDMPTENEALELGAVAKTGAKSIAEFEDIDDEDL